MGGATGARRQSARRTDFDLRMSQGYFCRQLSTYIDVITPMHVDIRPRTFTNVDIRRRNYVDVLRRLSIDVDVCRRN